MFSSQHPPSDSQLPITLVPEDPTPSSDLWRHQALMWCTDKHSSKMSTLNIIFKMYLFLFYVHWCFTWMCARSPETGVTDSYEHPCGCWELNPDSLGEQSVVLTTEPTLQHSICCFYSIIWNIFRSEHLNWRWWQQHCHLLLFSSKWFEILDVHVLGNTG